jgi:hypothetical protein
MSSGLAAKAANASDHAVYQRRGAIRGKPGALARSARGRDRAGVGCSLETPIRGGSSAKKEFAVLSPYVGRSHIRTLRAGAAANQQCEVTQVKIAVTGPGHVGTVTAAPGPLQGS